VAEHAVLQLPNRTFRVPQLTKAEYDELMMLRCLNEGLAARLAAEGSTPALLKSMRGHNAALKRAVERTDVVQALKANQRFHFAVYESAGSPQLMSLIKSFWLRIGPFLSSIFVQQPDRIKLYGESVKLHQAIVAAIEERDGRAAERALINDFKTASQWYVAFNWRDR
jgi:DNA-binding GntR family transcriptional regulator